MAIDDGSELEDLMFCSTVVLFDNDVEEPKPKNDDFGFGIYLKVAIVIEDTTVL